MVKVRNFNSCLPKRDRQTAQTQIRLLLKKQSDQGLPCLLFRLPFIVGVSYLFFQVSHFFLLFSN